MLHICKLEEKAMQGCAFLRECKQIVEDEEEWIVEDLWDEEDEGRAIDIHLDRLDGNHKALSEVILNIMHFRMATTRKKNQFLKLDMSDNQCACPECDKPVMTEGMYLKLADEVKRMNDLSMGTFAELILTKLLDKKLVGKDLEKNMKPLWETMHKIVETQWSGYMVKKPITTAVA